MLSLLLHKMKLSFKVDEFVSTCNYLSGPLLGLFLQKLKTVLDSEDFDLICKGFDETTLTKLSVMPWSFDQISSIFNILNYMIPENTQISTKANKQMLKFVANSQDVQWMWSKSNPKAIAYFLKSEEILDAVMKKLKMILTKVINYRILTTVRTLKSVSRFEF